MTPADLYREARARRPDLNTRFLPTVRQPSVAKQKREARAVHFYRLYQELGSLALVGAQVGLSGQAVSNSMQAGGFRAYKRGTHPNSRRAGRRRDVAREAEVVRLSGEGWSVASIAALVGCSMVTACRARMLAGIATPRR